jgi:hypothetical protein
MPTVEELEERLSALETKLAEKNKRRVLRDSLTCPSCDNTEIFHISKLEGNQGTPVRVGQARGFSFKSIGVLELYLCSQCGYGEVQLDSEQLKNTPRDNVKIISRAKDPPDEEPYR